MGRLPFANGSDGGEDTIDLGGGGGGVNASDGGEDTIDVGSGGGGVNASDGGAGG
jgi:hypothetical protein